MMTLTRTFEKACDVLFDMYVVAKAQDDIKAIRLQDVAMSIDDCLHEIDKDRVDVDDSFKAVTIRSTSLSEACSDLMALRDEVFAHATECSEDFEDALDMACERMASIA